MLKCCFAKYHVRVNLELEVDSCLKSCEKLCSSSQVLSTNLLVDSSKWVWEPDKKKTSKEGLEDKANENAHFIFTFPFFLPFSEGEAYSFLILLLPNKLFFIKN